MTAAAALSRRYAVLDVFTAAPLLGNPLAVVIDAEGLSDAQMAAYARWTNLSETTFLLPPADPAADYRVRIFTPGGELPFAGHPTLGSAQAWLDAGGVPRHAGEVVQECGVGLVRVRRIDGHATRLAFQAPPLRRSGPADAATVAQVLTSLRLTVPEVLQVEWIDNGPGWLGVRLADAAAGRALQPDFAVMAAAGLKIGAVGAWPAGGEVDVEVRAFVPELGVPEDPVTGSLNAGLAQWLTGAGLLPARYVAGQGHALGRDGRVHVERIAAGENAGVWIAGDVTRCVSGTLRL
ncbi:PhzF family phenazine biosynthesis protein [Sphaerotilus natans subsp. natans DSM 6575]|uniref:PhzF family phenazine biosynthesis protein n=1 Tax=Sphaerotilus natans subsp. natans DSM 6575 TaxID=1286631 RepID=A0A059KSF2_9BURK|nr:PhzF family phenazine biosynthesis protein [Sphaerotilus natans]KDB54149.1 PhzF family phenazine biosynthesis protein [Sphaerotilus natans subsp. natans DSM 6575]